jgi:hypothetical protein
MRTPLLTISCFTLATTLFACSSSDGGSSSTTDSSTSDTASGGDSAKSDTASNADTTADADTILSDSSSADTTSGDAIVDASGDAPAVSASDSATDAPKCTGDADCRAFSVECDGKCACLALASSEPDPTCGTPTECFADPCAGRHAVCGAGNVCVIE